MNTNKNPKFYMMIGLPGSGKSKYALKIQNEIGAVIHSSDELRKELFNDENDNSPKNNNILFEELRKRIKGDLSNNLNVILDATNISMKKRKNFLQNELKNVECKKIAVLVATPFTECLARNQMRDRQVPEEVIKRMVSSFQIPYWYEGWDDIILIRPSEIKENGNADDLVEKTVRKLYNFDQKNKHHALSLGEHLDKAHKYIYDNAKASMCLKKAALLHDIGKPFVCKFENTKGEPTEEAHYYCHENAGAYISIEFWDSNALTENILHVAVLIQWHMGLHIWKDEKICSKYKKLLGEDIWKEIELLHEADIYAH